MRGLCPRVSLCPVLHRQALPQERTWILTCHPPFMGVQFLYFLTYKNNNLQDARSNFTESHHGTLTSPSMSPVSTISCSRSTQLHYPDQLLDDQDNAVRAEETLRSTTRIRQEGFMLELPSPWIFTSTEKMSGFLPMPTNT